MSKWQERIASRRAKRIEQNAKKKALYRSMLGSSSNFLMSLGVGLLNHYYDDPVPLDQRALDNALEIDRKRRAQNKTVAFLKSRFGMSDHDAAAAAGSPQMLNALLPPPMQSRLVN